MFHVDSVAAEREVVFAEAHAYGAPPLDTFIKAVSSPRALFHAILLKRNRCSNLNRQVLEDLGFLRGVTHAEFLKAHSDGKLYFLEVAARVGGAYISDVIDAATGINLWREQRFE